MPARRDPDAHAVPGHGVAAAIRGTAQVEVGLAEALANVAVLQAATRSLRTGTPTPIGEIMAEIEES